MPIIDLQGETRGQAIASSDTAYPWPLYLAGVTSGTAGLDGWLGCVLWASGAAYGYGDLSHPEPVFEAQAEGVGAATGVLALAQNLHGAVFGNAHVYDSLPLPICGTAVVEGELELDPTPTPICKRHEKNLCLGQLLQKGDLELHIKALDGTPLSPYAIDYTLYKVLPPNGRIAVGGTSSAPAQGPMGHYYATGYLDGQPGPWLIVWHYQIEFNGTVQEQSQEFVVEEVRVRCEDRAPWNPNWERCRKKGWD